MEENRIKELKNVLVMDNLSDYINSIRDYKILTREEERDLFIRNRMGDEDATLKLFLCNLKLVYSAAKKYFQMMGSLTEMDIIQEGNLGLLKAIKNFDLEKNMKFSTYAYQWICKYIKRAIENDNLEIRIPTYLHHELKNYKETVNTLTEELQREPTIEEIALKLKISVSKVISLDLVLNKNNLVSLNKLVGESEDTKLEVFFSDKKEDLLEDIVLLEKEKEKKKLLVKWLTDSKLTKKQLRVLILRFGLKDGVKRTLGEVGEILHITMPSVLQHEKRALELLRKSKHIYEIALLEDFPIKSLENIGYSREEIDKKLIK